MVITLIFVAGALLSRVIAFVAAAGCLRWTLPVVLPCSPGALWMHSTPFATVYFFSYSRYLTGPGKVHFRAALGPSGRVILFRYGKFLYQSSWGLARRAFE